MGTNSDLATQGNIVTLYGLWDLVYFDQHSIIQVHRHCGVYHCFIFAFDYYPYDSDVLHVFIHPSVDRHLHSVCFGLLEIMLPWALAYKLLCKHMFSVFM